MHDRDKIMNAKNVQPWRNKGIPNSSTRSSASESSLEPSQEDTRASSFEGATASNSSAVAPRSQAATSFQSQLRSNSSLSNNSDSSASLANPDNSSANSNSGRSSSSSSSSDSDSDSNKAQVGSGYSWPNKITHALITTFTGDDDLADSMTGRKNKKKKKEGLIHRTIRYGRAAHTGARLGIGLRSLLLGKYLLMMLLHLGHLIVAHTVGPIVHFFRSIFHAVVHFFSAVASVIGKTLTGLVTVTAGVAVAAAAFSSTGVFQPKDPSVTGCSNQSSEESFDANFKITPVGGDAKVSEAIEKWCAQKHMDAAQCAAVLGSAMQESTMSSHGTNYNLLGWSNGAGTTADHSHDTSNVTEYMNRFWNHFSQSESGAPEHFLKDLKGKSPTTDEEYWGHHVEVCGKMGGRVEFANDFYKKIAGGHTSGIVNGGDADDNNSNTQSDDAGGCGQQQQAGADGTGSIKEHVPVGGLHYKPDEVPSDIKTFTHDPKSVGMSYNQGGKGWPSVGGECVQFSVSYFDKLWHQHGSIPGNGVNIAPGFAKKMGGSTSSTPHAGADVSVPGACVPLTNGNSAGHTFVVQHVLADGDCVCAEQNWPGKSGDDHGSPGPETWDFAVYPKSTLSKYAKFFTPKNGQPNFG